MPSGGQYPLNQSVSLRLFSSQRLQSFLMAEPTLFDASLFQRSQTIEARAAYSQLLVRCLVDHGYVKIFNHGIPPEVIYQAFEWVRSCGMLFATFSAYLSAEPEIFQPPIEQQDSHSPPGWRNAPAWIFQPRLGEDRESICRADGSRWMDD